MIRSRQAAAAREAQAARVAGEERLRATRRSDVGAIRSDASRLLEVLAAADYPDGTILRVFDRMTLFGREKRVDRAAWEVCTYGYEVHGDEVSGTVFLLSDGRFAFTPRGTTAMLDLDEVAEAKGPNVYPPLGPIAAGLAELLARYG